MLATSGADFQIVPTVYSRFLLYLMRALSWVAGPVSSVSLTLVSFDSYRLLTTTNVMATLASFARDIYAIWCILHESSRL